MRRAPTLPKWIEDWEDFNRPHATQKELPAALRKRIQAELRPSFLKAFANVLIVQTTMLWLATQILPRAGWELATSLAIGAAAVLSSSLLSPEGWERLKASQSWMVALLVASAAVQLTRAGQDLTGSTSLGWVFLSVSALSLSWRSRQRKFRLRLF